MCNKLCVMGESSGPKPDNVTTSSFKMSVYHGEAASDYSEERYFKSLRAWQHQPVAPVPASVALRGSLTRGA